MFLVCLSIIFCFFTVVGDTQCVPVRRVAFNAKLSAMTLIDQTSCRDPVESVRRVRL